MEKSLKSFLLLSSLSVLFSGCTVSRTGQKFELSPGSKKALNQRISTGSYDTKIDFFNKHLSGLLVFKALNDTTKRVVFITETGFKFFDFEFTPAGFAVRYCLSALNKKPILNIFKNDLGLIVNGSEGHLVGLKQKNSLKTYIFAGGKKYDYFTLNEKQELVKIESGGKVHKAVSVSMPATAEPFDSLAIVHHGVGLKISMKKIVR